MLTPDKEKWQQAAGVIQQQWRRRRAINRQQKFQEKTERAVVDIQCYLQGHLSRKTLLQQQTAEEHAGSQLQSIPSSDGVDGMSDISSGDESSAIIEDIQSAIRGHFTREMALRDFKRYVGCTCYAITIVQCTCMYGIVAFGVGCPMLQFLAETMDHV